ELAGPEARKLLRSVDLWDWHSGVEDQLFGERKARGIKAHRRRDTVRSFRRFQRDCANRNSDRQGQGGAAGADGAGAGIVLDPGVAAEREGCARSGLERAAPVVWGRAPSARGKIRS